MSSSSRPRVGINTALKAYFKKKKKVCICCTSKNGPLISLENCKHTNFFEKIIQYKIDVKNAFVCSICHNMLQKIEVFKLQVEESVNFLATQTRELQPAKLYNLQSMITSNEFQEQPMDTDIEIKMENIVFDPILIKTEVKLEYELPDNGISDNEVDSDTQPIVQPVKKKRIKTPAKKPVVKQSKVNRDKLYKGKLQTVTLTEEEMLKEREDMRNNEAYLKLPFKCEDCIVGFDHELTLVSHMEQRHNKNDMTNQCHICKSVLSSKPSHVEHMRRHLKRVECLECHVRYHDFKSAIHHYDEKHALPGSRLQSEITCDLCGFTTDSHRVYRYHRDKHRHQGLGCKICGVSYVNSTGLRLHMYKVHTPSNQIFSCDQCDKSYKAKSGLKAHIRYTHNRDPEAAYCTDCNTHYRDDKTLAHHLATHSRHITENDKRYICDECGAKYITRYELKKHINFVHLKISISCTGCDKLFRKESDMRRHYDSVHLKKRPPRDKMCHFCGRGFTERHILDAHIRTHTGERPLNCTYCAATFAHPAALYTHCKLTQRILESHIRTHTGERPLQCTHCPATFAHAAALYTHCKLLHKKYGNH